MNVTNIFYYNLTFFWFLISLLSSLNFSVRFASSKSGPCKYASKKEAFGSIKCWLFNICSYNIICWRGVALDTSFPVSTGRHRLEIWNVTFLFCQNLEDYSEINTSTCIVSNFLKTVLMFVLNFEMIGISTGIGTGTIPVVTVPLPIWDL